VVQHQIQCLTFASQQRNAIVSKVLRKLNELMKMIPS